MEASKSKPMTDDLPPLPEVVTHHGEFWTPEVIELMESYARLAIQSHLEALRKLSETCCGHCDYDEAEGGLMDHCDKCCRKITTKLWEITHARGCGD